VSTADEPPTAGCPLLHVAIFPAGTHRWSKPCGARLVEVVRAPGGELIVATFGSPE
jgi:hypothetical protein